MRAVIADEVLSGVFDLERNSFIDDVPTMMERGYDIDNASVNFRGVMVPAGTDPAIIDHLAVLFRLCSRMAELPVVSKLVLHPCTS
ncbi:hypothetical protein OCA8868_02878 [Octadecabacter ascidiaceicola]|uniref:Uncharacterized protein n=1 Tax=Octadecabacter ascidiaceicola TaxID=1655543 RepID=A0A238KM22_9RHOB|nr:hypothetical protein OCA8868_02878 [Octadecabacter ascidiaceicola]